MAGGPQLSEAYRRELRQCGAKLIEPFPDPLRGPQGNCWLLRGARIRQVRCHNKTQAIRDPLKSVGAFEGHLKLK